MPIPKAPISRQVLLRTPDQPNLRHVHHPLTTWAVQHLVCPVRYKSLLQDFYAAATSSSWRIVVHGAGHAQFFKGPWIVNKLGDLLCGHGNNSHAVRCPTSVITCLHVSCSPEAWACLCCTLTLLPAVDMHQAAAPGTMLHMAQPGCVQEAISLTLHPMIAWFDQHLRPDDQLIQVSSRSRAGPA